MVFTRALKASIERTLTKIVVLATFIMLAICFIVDAVFAQTGMDIPVAVSWSDRSDATRPSSVTLRLMNGNTTVSTLTLTSANTDSSDSDKWVGVFDGIPYGTNYTIVEDSVSGYSITSNNLSPQLTPATIDSFSRISGANSEGSHNLGDVNYIIARVSNGNYGLWTLEDYSGAKYDELLAQIRQKMGSNITIDQHVSGLNNPRLTVGLISGGVNISGSEGNISINVSYAWFNLVRISDIYAGNATIAGSNSVTFENVEIIPTYNLTVHHLNEDNSIFATDVVTTYNEGDTYTASPISDPNYTPELKIGSATGIITQDTEVTYVYHPKFHDVIYQFAEGVQPPNASSLLPATVTYNDGDTVTVAPEPTDPQGYRFLGWQMNGQSVSGTFTMPSQNVIITGSWERFNGHFAPTISKHITNVQNGPYRFGDTVEFQITVTNTANFPITNVRVTENLLGANFVAGSGYTLSSDTEAVIASIPANSSVILTAEYEIPDDITRTRTNTVEITSASASDYYFLDPDVDYTTSVQFATQSWQDVPVLTGVSTNSTILYFVLMLLGAVGIGGSIVAHQVNIKEREK